MWWWMVSVVLFGFLQGAADSRMAPSLLYRPYRMKYSELTEYVAKTFGPLQHCLKVAVDDTAEATDIVAMLHNHRHGHNGTVTRTIELDESGDSRTSCLAYVVIGRWQQIVNKYLDYFRHNGAERMLMIVVQKLNPNKSHTKFLPAYFNYKDVILISLHPEREKVFQMSIYHNKFISVSKQKDRWFIHDLEGKQKVKNFYHTHVKVLAHNNSFFSIVQKNHITGKMSLLDGIECKLFIEIAAMLNITWDVYTTNEDDKWGTVWPNNTVTGGTLRWLANKKADVSFCSLWIEHHRIKLVDMSKFWTNMCLKFLVNKPRLLREKWDLLFKPFSLSMWLLVIFSATLTIITVWILACIQKKIGYASINVFTSLSSTIFWIIGMMLLCNNLRTYRMGPIRHLISWWCVFIFIVTVSFSSILYSNITSTEYTDIILDVEDMVKADYKWGVMYTPYFDFTFEMQDPVHQAFSKRFVREHNIEDRINRLKNGKYAILVKTLYEKHFMEMDNIPVSILNELRATRTCMNQYFIGLGFVKHSPYLKSANLVIQRVFESGLIDYWLSRTIESRRSPAAFKHVYEVKPRKNEKPSALSYAQFKVVMIVWIVGCALSILVFIIECQTFLRIMA